MPGPQAGKLETVSGCVAVAIGVWVTDIHYAKAKQNLRLLEKDNFLQRTLGQVPR